MTVKSTQPKGELDQKISGGPSQFQPMTILSFCVEEGFQEQPSVPLKLSLATSTSTYALIADSQYLPKERTAGETSHREQRGQPTFPQG